MTDFVPIPTSELTKDYGCERCGRELVHGPERWEYSYITASYWREDDVPEDEPWCVCGDCYSDLTGGAE